MTGILRVQQRVVDRIVVMLTSGLTGDPAPYDIKAHFDEWRGAPLFKMSPHASHGLTPDALRAIADHMEAPDE